MKFEKHIFICTNQRGEGEKKSCGEECGMALVKSFKKALKDNGLKGRMRAQRAGCLDACETGPTVVVYPEGIYYGGVQQSDVDEIVKEHLFGKQAGATIGRGNINPMNDIEKFRTDIQVLKETAQQAEKDFSTCGLYLALTEEILPYEELLKRVVDQVEESIRRSGALQNLLYRVDIPESKFIELKDTSENFVYDLSRMILEREFMKVVTRRMYKN